MLLTTGLSLPLFPQNLITLKECYESAASANALSGEKETYTSISQLKDENLAKGWLPTLDANASANYISDVVDFKKAMAGNPLLASVLTPMPHDQYKITLDINQVIYDGGAIKNSRAIEKAELGVNQKQTETDLYKLRNQVNSYYFSIMILDRQAELLKNYKDLINKKLNTLTSGADNGVILKSDIDVLTSEKIKLEQQVAENRLKRTALVKNLAEITGKTINPDTQFVLPADQPLSAQLSRPELDLFDLKKDQLSAGLKLTRSKRMPKAFGFATLGYGNPPGNNFFENNFDTYYIVGGGIKWNIFDWNRTRNDQKVIAMQQGILDNRKKDLEDNLNRQLEIKKSEIASLQELLNTDSTLIVLRKRISTSADSQYRNGTITATELMNELNAEHQALINYEIHKISLAMARIEYLNISGKELE